MSEPYLRIVEESSVNVVELSIPLEVDSMAIDRLIGSLVDALHASPNHAWVVDLSKAAYLNSAGLGLLVNVREKVRQAKGKLVLCAMSPQLLALFKSCCLERLFTIAKSRSEAIGVASR
jgi:anti-anti-sigma factor